MISKLHFVYICFISLIKVRCQEVSVSTSVGIIIGTTETATFDGDLYTVKQFLGIPYAKSPIGELRFKKPEPLPSLQSPFKALKFGYICPQIILPGEPLVGVQDEDCLHLNIFVPSSAPDNNSGHAVMIWIHGGAFIVGSSDEYDSKILAGFGNVIVVTINYRLGPLGFFSTMDSNCPGNFGLWDQKMALKWVRDNIAPFGGDINRITVFGESAGAISGIMQGMVPENKGLFQRIIASSGSPSVRSMNCSRNTLTGAMFIAGKVGCAFDDTAAMINCLRKVTWQDYMAVVQALNENTDSIEYLIFDPVVDGDIIKHEPRDIYEMSKTRTFRELEVLKSFDLMSGMNAHEGAYYIMYFIGDTDKDEFMPTREEMRKHLLPAAMNLVYNRTFSDTIMKLVESEYTVWSNPDDYHNVRVQFAKIFGDTGFAVPSIEFAQLHLTSPPTSKTYVYRFMPSPSKRSPATPIWTPGANHADDIWFYFGFPNQPDAEPWEIELSKHMMRYWTNFAKRRDPNSPSHPGPVWHEYDKADQHYMELDRNLSVDGRKQYVFAREINFWLEIFPQLVTAVDRHERNMGMCFRNDTSAGNTLFLSLAIMMTVMSSAIFLQIF